MHNKIKSVHYTDITFDENNVQKEPLFLDYVGKPIWNVNEANPLYTIDLSNGFSFNVAVVKQSNYGHVIDAHKGGNYSKLWLFFREKGDANAMIKKVRKFIEESRYVQNKI